MDARFGLTVVVASAHAALLWGISLPPSSNFGGRNLGTSTAIHIRHLAAPVVPTGTTVRQPVLRSETAQPRLQKLPRRKEPETLVKKEAKQKAKQQVKAPASESVSLPAAETVAPAPTWVATDGLFKEDGAFDLNNYLPRNLLTATAEPLAPIDVVFPEEITGVVDLKVRLSVFINEAGVVKGVRLDTPNVPSIFVSSIMNAFLNARFKPGEVNTVPVPTMIHLEVAFQNGPLRPALV